MNVLERLLQDKEILIADGATGTNLFDMGLSNGASGELWCVDKPELVRKLHQSFIDAGADILLTNSFSSNHYRFALHQMPQRVTELATAAARLAREIADRTPRPVLVAGSMGPTGEMIEPLGECTQREAQTAFEEQATALKSGGADLLWIETMFSEQELAAAITAADAIAIPYVATMTFDTSGRTMMGLSPEQAARNIKHHGSAPAAYGANCGMGPAQLIDTVLGLARGAESGDILVAKGNAGLPSMDAELHVHYDASPREMAEYACLARDAGARIIGGCCGTTGEHLRAMAGALASCPRQGTPDLARVESLLGPVNVVAEQHKGDKPRRRRRAQAALVE